MRKQKIGAVERVPAPAPVAPRMPPVAYVEPGRQALANGGVRLNGTLAAVNVQLDMFMQSNADELHLPAGLPPQQRMIIIPKCNSNNLIVTAIGEGDKVRYVIKKQPIIPTHDGRFFERRQGESQNLLDKLQAGFAGNWVYFTHIRDFQAKAKVAVGAIHLGVSWWGPGYYKLNPPAQIFQKHFENCECPQGLIPRTDLDFENYQTTFLKIQALGMQGQFQANGAGAVQTLYDAIQNMARSPILADDNAIKAREVLAARAYFRLVRGSTTMYVGRIGEMPSDTGYTHTHPPTTCDLPDPAGLANATKIGSVSIPVRASNARGAQWTEEKIAEELAKTPHGIRFANIDAAYRYAVPTVHNLFDYRPQATYLSSRGESVRRNSHFKPFLEAMPIFMPNDKKPRSKVPLRVLFVDSRTAKAEWSICQVKNRDTVANVVEELKNRYDIKDDEQIVLATVRYSPEKMNETPFNMYSETIGSSQVIAIHTSHGGDKGEKRRASKLPNYYRPFSRTKDDATKGDGRILVAYKTRKAEFLRIVHPVLKKTLKQRMVSYTEYKTSKGEALEIEPLGLEFQDGEYLQACSIPIIIDAEGSTLKSPGKRTLDGRQPISSMMADSDFDSQLRTYIAIQNTWDEIRFPETLSADERSALHRAAKRQNGIVADARTDELGLNRIFVTKRVTEDYMAGGLSESLFLRKNIEPILRMCTEKYASEEVSHKRDRDGEKLQNEVVGFNVAHLLHGYHVGFGTHKGGTRKALVKGLTKALTDPSVGIQEFSKAERASKVTDFKATTDFVFTKVTAVIKLDDENTATFSGVQRGLLPGGAESTADALDDLKKNKETIEAQVCECQAMERSQRMSAEIVTASMTFFASEHNRNENRLTGFQTCGVAACKCVQPEIRVTTKMRKEVHNDRDAWHLDVDIYVHALDQRMSAFNKVFEQGFSGQFAYLPHDGWKMDKTVLPRAIDAKAWVPLKSLAPPNLYDGLFRDGERTTPVARLKVTIPFISNNSLLQKETNEYEHYLRLGSNASGVVGIMKALEMEEYPSMVQPVGLTVTMHDYQLQTLRRMIELEKLPGGFRDIVWYDVSDLNSRKSTTAQSYLPQSHPSRKWMYSPGFDKFAEDTSIPKTPRGGFLCEEMGLGKTIEVLGLILAEKPPPEWVEKGETLGKPGVVSESVNMTNGTNATDKIRSGATLVICAVSLVGQWIDEAKSKLTEAAGLRILMYHGQTREKNPRKIADNYDLIVTTYQTLAADRSRDNPLSKIEYYRLVCDESHMTKSYNSIQSVAASEICAVRRWACTGTPLATNSVDLFGQFAMLGCTPWGTCLKTFRDDFNEIITAVQRRGRHYGYNDRATHQIQRLLSFLKPITIRHTKTQRLGKNSTKDLLQLPPKTVHYVPVTLLPEEQRLYDELHAATAATWEQKYKAYGHALVAKRTFGIMSLLHPVRRMCSGGRLTQADLKIGDDAADALDDVGVGAGGANGVNQEVKRVKMEEKVAAPQPVVVPAPMIRGDVNSIEIESKLRVLVAELKHMRRSDPTNKALIFTQFAQTIEWLQKRLPDEGFGFRTIDGSMSAKNRDKSIQAFQKDPPTTVFILSLRSGAVGINLTAASHVFMLEPCMNPALTNQAIGRAWRMGQTRPVTVKILTVTDSIETNIVNLVEKRSIGTVNKDVPDVIDMDEEAELVRRAQMNKGQLAGALRDDKQQLKLEEFDLLFSRGNILPPHLTAPPAPIVNEEKKLKVKYLVKAEAVEAEADDDDYGDDARMIKNVKMEDVDGAHESGRNAGKEKKKYVDNDNNFEEDAEDGSKDEEEDEFMDAEAPLMEEEVEAVDYTISALPPPQKEEKEEKKILRKLSNRVQEAFERAFEKFLP